MTSSVSRSIENPEGGPSTRRQDELVVEQAGDSKQPVAAFHGQSSLAYAAALVPGGGPSRTHAVPHAQVEGLSMPYQPCYRTQKTATTVFENPSMSKLDTPLPTSFKYARQIEEQLRSPYPPPPCQCPTDVKPTSAEVVGAPKDQIQDLRTLAQWLRLHDPTLPPRIVGDIESDPCGVADRYGVKGASVLTAFIDMDELSCRLSCRVCGFKEDSLQLAVLHQQQEHYFQL